MTRTLTLGEITSVDELRDNADAWDDLWLRSDVEIPTARAELLAQWLEYFAPDATLRILVVSDGEKFIAALPLHGQAVGGLWEYGQMPWSPWGPCGELLLDLNADADSAVRFLARRMAQLPWQLVRIGNVYPATARWQRFLAALEDVDIVRDFRFQEKPARFPIQGDVKAYEQQLSKRHRKVLARNWRQLRDQGATEVVFHHDESPREIERLLADAFEVENSSWKGDAGTSILQTSGMARFMVRQSQQLSQWGQFQLAMLRHSDRLIAFEFGWRSKGVYFGHKSSYSPEYAEYGPGQLLVHAICSQLNREANCHAFDMLGPPNQSLARWKLVYSPVGRLTLAPRGLLAKTVVRVRRKWSSRSTDTPMAGDVGSAIDETPQSFQSV